MKKLIFSLLLAILLTTAVSGCNFFKAKQTQNIAPQATSTEVSILLSAEDPNKYCNGADMDSEGFRKTITQKNQVKIDKGNLSPNQLIIETLAAAANNSEFSIYNNIDEKYLKIVGDTAYIQPIDGWAGVSIFLCYWKPFVEVNLMQFPEIKKVEWVNDQNKWLELSQ
ncbi:MAG: hypothetical protein NTZ49_00265 [Candidatus Parcubacteria bacterium]|nr:hypothetical protein [Candidatus Parcubacteria bacterium]